MARQVTHDGSDHSYRMVIEDKYKRLVVLRKRIRGLTLAQAAYVPLRTAWFVGVPVLLAGAPPHPLALPILGLSALLTLLYFAAFGFGKAHREKEFLVKLFGVGVFLLLAQVALALYQYHVFLPKGALCPALLARSFPRGLLGLTPGALKLAGQVMEAALDVLGLLLLGLLSLAVKEFVLEKRERREGGTKRD